MSKAFTRDNDEAPVAAVHRRRVPVPDGAPNYLTAAGARALRAELARLEAISAADRDADAEVRVQELSEHLATAEIVEPDPAATDRVRFGSAVTIEDASGEHAHYRIVGALEADPRGHAVSWQSPVAKALLGAQLGDLVTLPRAGEVEIIAIDAA